MSLPIYAFVQGDSLALMLLVPEAERVDELALRLARAAAPRVTLKGALCVVHRGQTLRGDLTLTEAGLTALERVDLVTEAELA